MTYFLVLQYPDGDTWMTDAPFDGRLSVVIPTMGRPCLVRTVASLLASDDVDHIEIIVAGVIHDPDVAAQFDRQKAAHPNIRHEQVEWPVGDSSRKKNRGAKVARSNIIAFVDDDVKVARDWPHKIREAFDYPHCAGLVSGPSLIPDDISLMGRLAGHALSSYGAGFVADRYCERHPEIRPCTWSRIIGCNMAYTREAFMQIGEFMPEFWPGEEMIAAYRAERMGVKLMFVPKAHVAHYPRQSLIKFIKQMWGYGATRIRLIRAKVNIEWTTLIPAVWVASWPLLLMLSFVTPHAFRLFLVEWLLYFIAISGCTAEVLLRTRNPKDVLLMLIIPVMHVTYGCAEWYEIFRPGQDLGEAVRDIHGPA